jgi:hypothetical protein
MSFSKAYTLKERDAMVDAQGIFSRNAEFLRFMGTHRQKDSRVACIEEAIDISNRGIQFQFDI